MPPEGSICNYKSISRSNYVNYVEVSRKLNQNIISNQIKTTKVDKVGTKQWIFAKSKSSKLKATFCSLGWSSLHKIATQVRLPDSGIAVQSLQGLVTKNPVFSAFIVFDKIFLLISHFIYKIDKFEQEIGTETKQLNSTNWNSWKHYKQIRDN